MSDVVQMKRQTERNFLIIGMAKDLQSRQTKRYGTVTKGT